MAEGRLPDFVIAGAMRSGTTSLYRYLGAHPEVYLAPKELQFFTEHFDNGVDWYRAQFASVGDAHVLGEATADYFARPTAMARIHEVLPEARLIASLRNPVDRAWSHYHLLRARLRDPRDFDEAIEAEIAAIADGGPDADGVIYLLHGLYDGQLERAALLFPRDRLFVSVFERMVADPVATYRSLCAFLGVDDSFVPANLGDPINPYVTFRSLRIRNWSRKVPGPMARVVARANTRRNISYPELEPAMRSRLAEFYAPHINRVEEWLGSEIPEWNPRSP